MSAGKQHQRREIGLAPSGVSEEAARARARAARLLAQKDRSEADLRERLERSGFAATVIEETLRYLRMRGLLNDSHLAGQTIDATLRKAPAGDALLLHRIAREGVPERLAEQAVAQTPSSERDRSRQMARLVASRLPETLDPATRWRRALSAMARRGFGEEEALDALRGVLGPEPEPPDAAG
jgi:regulatory protein